MTVNTQELRTEPFTELGSVLQRDAGPIILRWAQRAVEEQPNARRVHHQTLLDHLPAFLASLGRSLAETCESAASQHTRPAAKHGEQRWEAGWSLSEVVRDYQILRLVLIEYLEEALDRPLTGREVMALGLALDEATDASVTMYVQNREESLRQAEQLRLDQERKAREALEEADRRKDEFLAALAHELRNPLAPILHCVQILTLLPITDPTLAELKGVLERQTRQLTRLVDDLLDLSRVSRGLITLRMQRVELASVVEQAVQTSEPLIRGRHHQLIVHLPAEPLAVNGEAARLVQVLVNLLNNAAKYTPEGGRIELTADREDGEAVIRVRDNGVGIAPEMREFIFDLFHQEGRSRHLSQGGLGLGLALVRRLVELQGGRVSVLSDGPGHGSEFVVRLPALPNHQPGAPV